MVEFYQPRNGVVICLKLVPTFNALGSGLYVSDMTTVQSLMDRSEIFGWSTLGASIQTNGRVTRSNTTSNEPMSVFLAFKRPVRRVRNVKVRSKIHRKNHVKACRTKYGETWEEAGPGFLVEDDDRIAILCVDSEPSPISFDARVLVNINVAISTAGYPRGFEDPLELSESWQLCLKYDQDSMNTNAVSDLMLRTTETPSFNITQSLPNLTVLLGVEGKDTLVSSDDLNGNRSSLATFLASRSVQSSALASEESGYFRQGKENSLQARMPKSLKEGSPARRLRRQEEASSATNGLTFKIV